MRALFYLTKRSLINNLKRAVRKPSTLLALIFGVAYGIFLVVMLGSFAAVIRMDSVRGLLIIITVWSIYVTLGNLSAYSARKGVIFRPAHSHFVFTSPISPKLVLVNSAWMNYLFSAGAWILLAIGGLTIFQVAPWKVLLLFLMGCVLEIALEISIMVFLYANDHLSQKLIRGLCIGIRVFLVAVTLLILLYFRRNGLSMESASALIDWPVLQMIPVIGWEIAACRLILLGPTALNVAGTVLYVLTVIAASTGVYRMRCDGGYYEEAAKFADDYAEMRKKQKSGEVVMGVGGKKKRFRQVREHFRGRGAKAVFYRQLLEYKKEKYFIFSKTTLVCVFIAFVCAYVLREEAVDSGVQQLFLLGIIAYVSLVMTGYIGKWENELKSPYLFLLPDSAFKKLWYATAMEHVKAFVDGCVVCIPIAIFWKIHPLYVIATILIFVVLQANKLYSKVIAQTLLGDVFGVKGQDLLRACLQMLILGMGAGAAVLVGILVNLDFIFPILLIYSIIVTVAIGFLASLRFDTMEQIV